MSRKSWRVKRANSISSRAVVSTCFRSSSAERLAHPAGQAEGGVDLPSSQHADDVHGLAARLDDLGPGLHADLVDHPQDIALGHRGIRPHDEIRPAQDVEMDRVVGHVESRVKKLAQLLGRGRGIDVEDRVAGFRRG